MRLRKFILIQRSFFGFYWHILSDSVGLETVSVNFLVDTFMHTLNHFPESPGVKPIHFDGPGPKIKLPEHV